MILGKRIRIRGVEHVDLPTLVSWRNDPRVYQYFYEHEPLSMVMQKAWFEKLLTRSDERLWIAELIQDACPVGTIGLSHIDWRSRKAELARVLVSPAYRGNGLGSELVCLVLRYCFEHLNLNRLYLDTLADNRRAVDLYAHLGFTQEGILRQHVFKDGRYRDLAYMAMLREQFHSAEVQDHISSLLG
jgi:UDP-4-amino-4,6-dideoxy-N-acetyl-beta-L-altrosamine N-acetyltransferase